MHILIAALHRPIKPTGVCRHAVNLAKCLAQTDRITKISLVIGVWQLNYFKTAFDLDSPKIELVSVEISNSSLSRNLWFLFGLSKLAKQLKPDLIHLSFPLPFISQFFVCPVVSTIHDFYPYECPENFGYPNVLFNRWFLKQCINNSDGLSCVSKITLTNLSKYFPQTSLTKETAVVYNYVNFEGIKSTIPQNFSLKKSDDFLLCVAQHRQNKNLDLLIKAYNKLISTKRLKSDLKLAIVGTDGPETERLHHLIERFELRDSVLLLSSLDDSILSWLYQNCELFIIPSSTEGFCLPLAEAIYFSCQVVCSDIPIFREIGATNCHYFQLQKDSLLNLTNAIFQTLQESRSIKTLNNYPFTKEKTATQYLKLYDRVI